VSSLRHVLWAVAECFRPVDAVVPYDPSARARYYAGRYLAEVAARHRERRDLQAQLAAAVAVQDAALGALATERARVEDFERRATTDERAIAQVARRMARRMSR
jgi:hypothetical protein